MAIDQETFFENFAHLADAPNGVQKLRELILQLAVQGKLVPQDPNDEPAAKLLARIRAEKARLVKDKKIRKTDPLLPVTADEAPYELSTGWEWVRLRDVSRDYGQKIPDKQFTYIDVSAIDNANGAIANPTILEPYEAPSRARKLVQLGTVIYSTVRPYLLNIAVIEEPIEPEPIASTAFAILHPLGNISNKYLFWWLRSPDFIAFVESKMLGVAYPAINDSQFFSGPFPLPPLPEQHRIVAKVDQLMALCDELEAKQQRSRTKLTRLNNSALDRLTSAREADDFTPAWELVRDNFDLLYTTPETIAKLRQSILQLAVQGKLIAPISRERWEHGVLGDVVESSEAGWSPQCENRPRIGNEWGVLKVSAVSWDHFKPAENKALPPHLDARPEYEVKSGDFLISRANTSELVAKSVVVNDSPHRLSLSDKTVRLHFRADASPRYFCLVNNSPESRDYYAGNAGGTSSSMKNVTRKQILALPVLIPPLSEQHRIVAKVDQLMALYDNLEARLTKAQSKSEKLTSAAVKMLLAE
jgi:type I restriction enzyme S subunit